jgi:hypothetical protein
VAVAGSTVIEVHQVGTGEGPLSYHAAEIRANGSVVWAKKGFQYDSGLAPSVSASGPTIIEVHQVVSGVGALWYHMAGSQSSGTVKFAAKPFEYDSGEAPRASVAGAMIVEVHDSNSGVGLFLSHCSVLAASGSEIPKNATNSSGGYCRLVRNTAREQLIGLCELYNREKIPVGIL